MHEEVSDEEGDPARNRFRGNDEGDPRDGDEHSGWEKVAEYVIVDLQAI